MSRYQRVNQKKYCCVAACLEMIFRAEGYNLDQVSIACDLGLIVPEEYLTEFPCARTGEKPAPGWGTQIQEPEYSVWNYLTENSINLELTFYRSTEVTVNVLQSLLDTGSHIMVLFNYPKLYERSGSWGHASLIDEINDEKVQLIDPEKKFSKNREVDIHDLVRATKSKSVLGWGFWVFK